MQPPVAHQSQCLATVCSVDTWETWPERAKRAKDRSGKKDAELSAAITDVTGRKAGRAQVNHWFTRTREPTLSQFFALCSEIKADPQQVLFASARPTEAAPVAKKRKAHTGKAAIAFAENTYRLLGQRYRGKRDVIDRFLKRHPEIDAATMRAAMHGEAIELEFVEELAHALDVQVFELLVPPLSKRSRVPARSTKPKAIRQQRAPEKT